MGLLRVDRNISEDELKALNIQYVYEEKPGIRRRKCGQGFSFIAPDGTYIKCPQEKTRLKALAVPPSYKDVWYCPLPNGHLQATGLDTTQKKQYFYHSAWETLREQTKFSNMENFARSLPAFRRKISYILNHPDEFSHREQILSAMFKILDNTGTRIGSITAEERNNTFGLTTLKKRHVEIDGAEVHLEFKGKGGRELEYDLSDRNVARIIKECEDIPGQHFFDYLDERGERHKIQSATINSYLKTHMGQDYSAKDFRTWRFSCYFLNEALKTHIKNEKLTLKTVLDHVSEFSGNTPAVLKSSYIHPGLLECVRSNSVKDLQITKENLSGLLKAENYMLNFLKSKTAQDALIS